VLWKSAESVDFPRYEVGIDMDLSDGKYLGHDIEAVCGDWLVVYDGKYNYMLFNCCDKQNITQFDHERMPYNRAPYFDKNGWLTGGFKRTEFYTKFDTAVKNLCKVVANNGEWLTKTRVVKS